MGSWIQVCNENYSVDVTGKTPNLFCSIFSREFSMCTISKSTPSLLSESTASLLSLL